MLLVEMTVKYMLKYFVDIWTQIKYTTVTFACLTLCILLPQDNSAQDRSSSCASHPLPEATTLLPWNLSSGISPAIWRSAVTLLGSRRSLRPFFPHAPKHLADKYTAYLRQTPPVNAMVKAMGTSPDHTPFRIQQ